MIYTQLNAALFVSKLLHFWAQHIDEFCDGALDRLM